MGDEHCDEAKPIYLQKEQSLDEPDTELDESESEGILSCRQILSIIGFVGVMTVMLMRNNLSVAMVAMTGNTTTDTVDNIKKFDWNDRTQGHILGSVYYGVAFSGLPGGYFSSRYSAKYTCAVGMLLAAISSLLTPTAARIGYPVMIANRAIVGIGLGVIIPGLHGLLGKWCPPFERSRLANFTYAGFPIGTIVAMLVSGPLCDSTFLGGWPSVFYLAGILGCLFFIVWMYVVYDSPAVHPRISLKERQYIESTVGENNCNQVDSVPWLSMILSLPVCAVALSHFSHMWGLYALVTFLPTYFENVLDFSLVTASVLSAVPFLCLWLTFVVGSWIADTLLERHILGMSATRKLMNTMGFLGAAVFLVPAGYAGYWNRILTVALISLSMTCIGFCLSGYHTNSLDIAPRYSGVLYGYSSTLACSAGFIGPIIIGELLEAKEKHTAWLFVFCISAGVYTFGMIAFLVCGTAEEQAWGKEDKDERKTEDYDEISNE